MNVFQKINAARAAFHSQPLKKSGHNKFAGYDYFELGDFVIPALQVFADHGLTSIISFGEVASMTIVNNDKPEETIVITSPMSEANLKGCHAVQNLGAVQTYLRRYLWVAALEIVEHDALDATTGQGQPKEGKADAKVQASQAIAIDIIASVKGGNAMSEAKKLAGMSEGKMNAIWALLDAETQDKLTEVWPG
jgi:hypothetical protein